MSCDNKINCTCTYACENHGKCCACVEYHRKLNQVPGCFFTAKGEKTYDRSIKKLYNDKILGE